MAVVAAALLVMAPTRVQTTTMAIGSTHDEGSKGSDGKVLHLGSGGYRNLLPLADTNRLTVSSGTSRFMVWLSQFGHLQPFASVRNAAAYASTAVAMSRSDKAA